MEHRSAGCALRKAFALLCGPAQSREELARESLLLPFELPRDVLGGLLRAALARDEDECLLAFGDGVERDIHGGIIRDFRDAHALHATPEPRGV